jgi:hypothetical protein
MGEQVIRGWTNIDEYAKEEEAWREMERKQQAKPASDMVNHPDHYTRGGIECIDALEAATIDLQGIDAVCTANAIKYLWRWKHKNGLQDLKKARWYIDRLISQRE